MTCRCVPIPFPCLNIKLRWVLLMQMYFATHETNSRQQNTRAKSGKPSNAKQIASAFDHCHVVTVVSDRSRAKTGCQTRRIHLLLTYFGQLVATLQLVSELWVRIPLLARFSAFWVFLTSGQIMELVAHGSMVTIWLESPYHSAYRQVVVLARRGEIVTW